MIFLIIGCWIVSFFFNGIESGLLSINQVRLRQNVKKGVPAAMLLDRLLQRPERLLVTVLLFTNAAEIVGLILLTRWLVQLYGNAGFAISLAIALPIYLFLLGVLPKAIFRRFPFRALARLAGVLDFLSTLLTPLLNIGAGLGRLVLPNADKGRIFAAREELKLITAQSEQEGALTSTERAMIHNVFDFRGVKVRDVMVPMDKIVAVTPTESVDRVIEISLATGVDRLPVIEDGEPKGLINVLDVLLDRNGEDSLGRYMRRIVTATENEPAYRIVQRLRAARLGLAAVLDAQKHFSGIVTIEDLIRRIVSLSQAPA
jgi:CBS domain containing-hemolysin-like protein